MLVLTDDRKQSAYVGRNSVSSIGQNQSLTSLLNNYGSGLMIKV